MATFILVHGAWMGAWVWRDIIPLLTDKGHKVIASDLPGSGNDRTLLEEVDFTNYLDCLVNLINQQTENVILVGHSMGGMVISAVSEIIPDKIQQLIYLSAFLPVSGESMLDIVKKFQVNRNFEFNFLANYSACLIRDDLIDNIFFNCCQEEYIEYAKPLMRPQVIKIFRVKLNLTEDNFGSVAKVYVKCTLDNAITSMVQSMMIDRLFINSVYTLSADHCPFFSSATKLADILHLSSQSRN